MDIDATTTRSPDAFRRFMTSSITLSARTRASTAWSSQHAGFVAPPPDSLEPPLHHRMLALSTALPHHEGAGRWDNIVPAIPSDDQLMLGYIHHITDTPLPAPDVSVPMVVEPEKLGLPPLLAPPFKFCCSCLSRNPLPLPLPTPSPGLPPLFGSVAPLSIDLTGNDDELYETGVAPIGPEAREAEVSASEGLVKEERL
ncbi:hypothetical protein GG344DRAFT_83276 [Lentinula edodes]|nr:hypothetical protein GG344DRAFT_83276 [Lentinula edodes]